MIIGDRLRELREEKKLSQGDIEKRTGLLPAVIFLVWRMATLFRQARLWKSSLVRWEVPLYQLFYDGEVPAELATLPKRMPSDDVAWGSTGKEARFLSKLRRLLSKTDEGDRKLLLHMAQKMARR